MAPRAAWGLSQLHGLSLSAEPSPCRRCASGSSGFALGTGVCVGSVDGRYGESRELNRGLRGLRQSVGSLQGS